jgi:hypothetical protein
MGLHAPHSVIVRERWAEELGITEDRAGRRQRNRRAQGLQPLLDAHLRGEAPAGPLLTTITSASGRAVIVISGSLLKVEST